MNILVRALRITGIVWLVLASLLILAGTARVWMVDGFGEVLRLLSPFNLTNWIATLVTLAPGAIALFFSEKLKERQLHAGTNR